MGGGAWHATRSVLIRLIFYFLLTLLHQVCDGLVDCEGGQDEAGCGLPRCEEGELACLKGRCIPGEWKCDGRPDCSQGEDEVRQRAIFRQELTAFPCTGCLRLLLHL